MKVFAGVFILCSFCIQSISQVKKNVSLPNILFIVADDLGYADLGCYGSDIETPNIDKLAQEGIRFSRYHSAPLCAVARSMFLTGNDNHIAGMGVQSLVTGIEGYEGRLTDRVVTVPALLMDAGYYTCMAGKWHLGKTPEANPQQKGFIQSFVVLDGAANHFSSLGALGDVPVSQYTENGNKAQWPEGAYSTDFYTDKLISYIEDGIKEGKPFLLMQLLHRLTGRFRLRKSTGKSTPVSSMQGMMFGKNLASSDLKGPV